MAKRTDRNPEDHLSPRDRIDRLPGIAFDHVEISFIYSFLCQVPRFEDVANLVMSNGFPPKSPATGESERHRVLHGNEVVAAFRNKKKLESDVCYWSVGVHPERLGISPVIRFGGTGNGKAAPTQSDTGVCCWVRRSGPFEIRSDYYDSEFESLQVPETSLALTVNDYEIFFRLCSSGAGTVTFKFCVEKSQFPDILPRNARSRLAALFDHLGMLPFIFTILTLGRTESDRSRNGAPSSKIRHSDGRKADFQTLQNVFRKFLFRTALDALQLDADQPSRDGSARASSVDREVAGAPLDQIPPLWQAPYVCVIADLVEDATVVEHPDLDAHAWWYYDYSRALYSANWLPPRSRAGSALNVWRCYKEAILLLLRLYQWRDILEVDECLKRLAMGAGAGELPLPHWRRVLVLPDLMRETHFGNLFNDVDMVWDTRYLLLYHERSTLVLNHVGLPKGMSVANRSHESKNKLLFRVLFVQSLLNTLEYIRSQWHAAVILNAALDRLVARFQNPESMSDPDAFRDVAAKRQVYACALQDPLIPGVESASLSSVRRRAHRDFEISFLFQNLRDKFQAIDRFIVDQAEVRNKTYLQEQVERVGKHSQAKR